MLNNDLNVTPFVWLLLASFMVALVARHFKVPYALALVVTGLSIGVSRLLPQAHLEPSLLFTVFLPPLLFESAIHLRAEMLLRDWKPIAVYTLAGTVLSTFIVAGLATWILRVAWPAALVFGALISATDPISVIAVFKRLGAGKRLTLIMEAESLFNDGIAAVLFMVALGAATSGEISAGASLWQFGRLVIGGALLGAAVGELASRIHYGIDDHLVEITLTNVVAFGSYLCAEVLHVSGVMAVVAAGLVIGNRGIQIAMSPGTRLAVTAFWEYAAFVVNSMVFLLIGIEAASVDWTPRIGLVVGGVVIVLLGRAAIYPLSIMVNRLGGQVPLAWQHVLFWGGLRGALSMALALGLKPDFPARDTLVAATFGIVLFSLLAQGMTVGPLLKRLGLAAPPPAGPHSQRQLAGEIVACQAALWELERLRAAEAHPNWAVEKLLHDYRRRLESLEAMLSDTEPDHRAFSERQARRAQRLALTAGKTALQEAGRQGWLSVKDWQSIAARLDAELVDLS